MPTVERKNPLFWQAINLWLAHLMTIGDATESIAIERESPIVNQQCLVYKFECVLCNAGYVGFKRRHKNSSSSICKHFRDKHSLASKYLTKNFSVLIKCPNKFDCLVYEMFIRELKHARFWDADGNRKRTFLVLGPYCLPDFYTTRL